MENYYTPNFTNARDFDGDAFVTESNMDDIRRGKEPSKSKKTEKAYNYAREYVKLNPDSIRSKQLKNWFIENGYPVPDEHTDIDKEFASNGKFIDVIQRAITGSGDNKFLSTSNSIPSVKDILFNSISVMSEKSSKASLTKLATGLVLNRVNYGRIVSERLLKISQNENSKIVNIAFGISLNDRQNNIKALSDFLYQIKYSKLKVKEEKALKTTKSNKNQIKQLILRKLNAKIMSNIDSNGIYFDRLRNDCYIIMIQNDSTKPYIALNRNSDPETLLHVFAIGPNEIVERIASESRNFVELRHVSKDEGCIQVYTVKSRTAIDDEKFEMENSNRYHMDPFASYAGNKRKINTSKSKVLLDNTTCSETKAKNFEQLFIENKEDLVNFILEWNELASLYEELNMPHKLGIFLHGDPGTGKTSIAKAACRLLGKALLVGDLDNLDRTISIITDTENIEDYIILFEDVDLVIGNNAKDNEDVRQTKVNKLLQLLDGTISRNTLIFATTNDISALPENFLRKGRFDVNVEIGNLNLEYAERLCKSYNVKVTNELLNQSVRVNKEGEKRYNPSELQSACIAEIIHERESRLNGKNTSSKK